jgi:uncharacterized peroxidase-related enzyme
VNPRRREIMARVKMHDPETAKGWTGRLLKRVAEAGGGTVPNMFKALANSEWVLEAYLTLNGNLTQGKLGPALVKEIILATSEMNGCEYCVAANTAMSVKGGLLTQEQALNARRFVGKDDRSNAALRFAKQVLETRGNVSDAALADLRKAGFGDGEIMEVIGAIVAATLTNYVSHVAHIDLDFPEVPPVS